MKEKLTPAQKKLHSFLSENNGVTCWQVAKYMWPDSELWNPHKRVGRWVSLPGSSILIMKAGSMLHRLNRKQAAYSMKKGHVWYAM